MLKKNLPGIAWFFLVLILICLPGDDLPHPQGWMYAIFFDKWVHIGMFGMLAFLFMRPVGLSSVTDQQKKMLFFKIMLAAITWGITTEFIQKFFIAGRSFDLIDWAADSAGIILARLVAGKLYLHKKSRSD